MTAVVQAASTENTYVKGKLRWTTSTGTILPLKYTRVDLFDKDTNAPDLIGTTYTDLNGNYSFAFKNADGFWDLENGGYDVFIRCYPASETMQVLRVWNEIFTYYYQSTVVDNVETGTTLLNGVIAYNKSNMGNCAFYIEQAMVVGQEFAKQMGMKTDKIVSVQYPLPAGITTFCYSTVGGVEKGDFEDFDTLMHEYGHFVEGVMGTYGSGLLDFIKNDPMHYGYTDHFVDKADKKYAMELTWSESWATAFAQIAQEYYKSEYSAYVNSFADGSDTRYDMEKQTTNIDDRCEAQELAVTAFLWDLFDSGTSETYDNIALGYYIW